MRKLVLVLAGLGAAGAVAYYVWPQQWPGREMSDADVWGAFHPELPDAPWVKQPGYKLTPAGDGTPDDVRCSSYGAVFGSAPYVQCRAQLEGARIGVRRAD